jgi:hypothetical protein
MSYEPDRTGSTSYKNESKVVRYGLDGFDGLVPRAEGGYVTHADYKALEDSHAWLAVDLFTEQEQHESTKAELASLKARVGELVEADRAFDVCIASQVIDDDVYDRRQAAMEAFK